LAVAAMQTILPSIEIAPGRIIGLDPHTRTTPPLLSMIVSTATMA
jgi:hypothetical protein